jgi:hypothetical protein
MGVPLVEENGKLIRPIGDWCNQVCSKLGSFPGMIYTGLGYQFVNTTPNGGLGNGFRNDGYPTISFERQLYLPSLEGPKKPLYLIGWIGGYEKGSIMHVAWQFPHNQKFSVEAQEAGAFFHYVQVAEVMYDSRSMDSEVAKFIKG